MDVAHYQSRTLVEVAYKALKSDITLYDLPPGKKMIVRELAERYGVSETPIKQALNRLVSEGLVESIPRRGMKVRVVEWQDIQDIMDVRLMIETYAVKGAARSIKADPAALAELEALVREHEAVTLRIGEINEYYRNYSIDQDFHQRYVRCAGNLKMSQIYANLGTHQYMYYVFGKQSVEEMSAGVREHRDLLAALEAGDEAEAKKRIKIHIDNAKVKVSKAFDANRREHGPL